MTDVATLDAGLQRLAALYGVQTAYRDVDDRLVTASPEGLLGAVRALGVDVGTPADAGPAIEERRRQLADRWLAAVTPAFGNRVAVELRLPERLTDRTVGCHLQLETGEEHRWSEDLRGRTPLRVDRLGADRFAVIPLTLDSVPHGYHRLAVEVDGRSGDTLLIVAPPHVYGGGGARRRGWGTFVPLYALRTGRGFGVADLSDLAAYGSWMSDLGASIVGTLPLLPVYLGEQRHDPSPYSPVSRLFWNEYHLDLTRAPEWDRTGLHPPGLPDEGEVDWQEVAAAKDGLLRRMADRFFDDPTDRRHDLERFIDARPEVEQYALFRGAVERLGAAWWEWPATLRDGSLTFDDVDFRAARHHLYAQLLCQEQITDLSQRMRDRGLEPYLDLPIGTNRDGYDAWRFADVFALDASTGAPPDSIFTGGQNWRFPPLHPERLRESEYDYLIRVLRHHLELADHLRIDHVMGLHRLYWIPEGASARDGVYVRYPADDLYAILSIESHRHRSRIVGEDLGTVPPEVSEALEQRGVSRMYVVQYEVRPHEYDVLPPVPADAVASANTHDMPPFAAFWAGRDIDDQVDLGLLDEEQARRAHEDRGTVRWKLMSLLSAQGRLDEEAAADPVAVHAALSGWLGDSDAPLVLVNLEDLWGEHRPQNTPGTLEERPNWRRRTRYSLDELRERPEVDGPLRRLDAARRGGEQHG